MRPFGTKAQIGDGVSQHQSKFHILNGAAQMNNAPSHCHLVASWLCPCGGTAQTAPVSINKKLQTKER
jgi:hypothetical protein